MSSTANVLGYGILGLDTFGDEDYPQPVGLALLLSYDPKYTPIDLKIHDMGPNLINLTWTKPILQVSGYRVYRAYSNDEIFTPIGTTITTGFIDSGVVRDRYFFYRVTSIISGSVNDFNYVPQNALFGQDPNNYKNIVVSWSAPVNLVSGYRVYRSNHYDSQFTPIGYTADLKYIDSGVDITLPYYYLVNSLF